jgi:site-specific DNA-methyltransferase (adenine-specific)
MLTKIEQEKIYKKYNGHCAYCGKKISIREMHVDHYTPQIYGGTDSHDNLTQYLPPRNSWIVWDKSRDYETQHMAEGELAWTSFKIPLRIVRRLWCGCANCEQKSGIHPHEKPISLYLWLIKNYAKQGSKIFDSHLGSGSNRIAAHNLGFDFYGCEIDASYFEAQEKRFQKYRQREEIKSEAAVKQLSFFL